ncbi:hypothetical protein Q1695_010466 [Nippostrongylus brasiliensis]|nr:hypothetical protein Q1695_010466 [Nippostrongylus brasiliensis]
MSSSAESVSADSITAQKKQLRKTIGKLLSEIQPEEIKRQSDIVVQKVLSSTWFHNAQRISVYVHTSGEIETDRIVEESLRMQKQVFIPKFVRGNSNLQLLRIPSLDRFQSLKPALWGIRQPGEDDVWENYESTGALDLILMPGVAFTTSGCRLGHGMGYYDRALATHQRMFHSMPLRYGLALREQLVDSVPISGTDVNLDGIVHA